MTVSETACGEISSYWLLADYQVLSKDAYRMHRISIFLHDYLSGSEYWLGSDFVNIGALESCSLGLMDGLVLHNNCHKILYNPSLILKWSLSYRDNLIHIQKLPFVSLCKERDCKTPAKSMKADICPMTKEWKGENNVVHLNSSPQGFASKVEKYSVGSIGIAEVL